MITDRQCWLTQRAPNLRQHTTEPPIERLVVFLLGNNTFTYTELPFAHADAADHLILAGVVAKDALDGAAVSLDKVQRDRFIY